MATAAVLAAGRGGGSSGGKVRPRPLINVEAERSRGSSSPNPFSTGQPRGAITGREFQPQRSLGNASTINTIQGIPEFEEQTGVIGGPRAVARPESDVIADINTENKRRRELNERMGFSASSRLSSAPTSADGLRRSRLAASRAANRLGASSSGSASVSQRLLRRNA